MMWVGTPAYFAVVLIKTVWFDGSYNEHNYHWEYPPKVAVATKIEPSLNQCMIDGSKWELDGETAVLQHDVPILNGKWQCDVIATGGLTT